MPVKFYEQLANGKGKGSRRVNAPIHPANKNKSDLVTDEVGHHLKNMGLLHKPPKCIINEETGTKQVVILLTFCKRTTLEK